MDYMGMYAPMIQEQMMMQEQNMAMQNQMLLQNQNMSMQNQMMLQGQLNMGFSYDRYGMPKVTHKNALDMLRNYVMQTNGCYIQKEKKIEEAPQDIRHACVTVGVTKLPIQYFSIPEVGLNIPFYFCNKCGTLYIYRDFM